MSLPVRLAGNEDPDLPFGSFEVWPHLKAFAEDDLHGDSVTRER